MFFDVLWSILDQVMFFICNIFAVGFLISLLCRIFYSVIGGGVSGRAVCYATGLIGTPIHELSHAIMCILFGHKIVDINLYNIDVGSGTLGYVSHEYNPRNPYHILGNYFIGIAPVLMNTAVIYLLLRLLLPDTCSAISEVLGTFAAEQHGTLSGEFYRGVMDAVGEIIKAAAGYTEDAWRLWVFIILSLSIALHMNLSGSDIVSALSSLPILVGLIVVINATIAFVGEGIYSSFLELTHIGGIYILFALLFSLALSVVCIIIGALIRMLAGIIGHFRN